MFYNKWWHYINGWYFVNNGIFLMLKVLMKVGKLEKWQDNF
jgi:hypothetical protein